MSWVGKDHRSASSPYVLLFYLARGTAGFLTRGNCCLDLFSYHLLETTPATTVGAFWRPPARRQVPGLRHAECLAAMTLGAPILSPARMRLRTLAVFAAWESEEALAGFLSDTKLGRSLAGGWHVRLELLRRWGRYAGFDDVPPTGDSDPDQPVVAVTVARLKIPHARRFVRWGKPVEEQVRDHPGTTLALAAFRPLQTFSTFSVWHSQREMSDMVHGVGTTPGADRHAKAMAERNRKDFHSAFTTLRFRATSEHGEWGGKGAIVPGLDGASAARNTERNPV